MSLGNTPKSAAEAQKAIGELTPEQIKELSGVQQIIHYLKKGDWAAMAGAVMALWTEYFGSPEEKKKAAEAKKEAKEDGVKDGTQKDLSNLHSELEKSEDEAEKEAPAKAEVAQKSVELPSSSDTVLIGDSIMKGMQYRFKKAERPNFIGKSGNSSMKTLKTLRESKDKLRGKKRALIYTGGNNVSYSKPGDIVNDMISMTKICAEAGIKDIVVCTRFPNDPRRKSKMTAKSAALREALLKAHREGRFPAGVRVIDLYKKFADADGNLKREYVREKSTDYIHPRGAYKAALGHMLSGSPKV